MTAAAILDLLLPRACVACGGAMTDGIVCDLCFARLPLLAAPRCERCGHPSADGTCLCPRLPPYLRAARSVCWAPHAVSSRILAALKYEGWTAVAGAMAVRMARLAWPADVVTSRVALVPVPLAAVRHRARGYNQAALLADEVGARVGLPVWHDVVVRARATRTQTRLTPSERSANVHEAFAVPDAARPRLSQAHLVIVDDVLTTGATMNGVAAALFEAGAREFSYLTFGRARSALD